jgi:hypothetical protein
MAVLQKGENHYEKQRDFVNLKLKVKRIKTTTFY